MSTIRELYSEVNRILSEVFNKEDFEIFSSSAHVMLDSNNSELYFAARYFLKSKTKTIHSNVNSNSFESVLEKLRIQANFDKDNFRVEIESKGKPTIDIEFGI